MVLKQNTQHTQRIMKTSGKIELVICLGSSCFSRGNRETLEALKAYLKENKLEDRVMFKGQLCSGSCNTGPVIWINGKQYEAVTPAGAIGIIEQSFAECHER